jgi:hypothetical protein
MKIDGETVGFCSNAPAGPTGVQAACRSPAESPTALGQAEQ